MWPLLSADPSLVILCPCYFSLSLFASLDTKEAILLVVLLFSFCPVKFFDYGLDSSEYKF